LQQTEAIRFLAVLHPLEEDLEHPLHRGPLALVALVAVSNTTRAAQDMLVAPVHQAKDMLAVPVQQHQALDQDQQGAAARRQ